MAFKGEFYQAECQYHDDIKAISIKVTNNVLTHQFTLSKTWVKIPQRSMWGMHYGRDYKDLDRFIFRFERGDYGFLSIEYTVRNQKKEEKIGYLKKACWHTVKDFLSDNPDSKQLELVEIDANDERI